MATDLAEVLAGIDLFATLSYDLRARIAAVGRIEHWKAGATVLEEGTLGPRMLVVLEGTLEILRRDRAGVQRAVSQIEQGEMLGEMSLLLDLPRTATVRASSDAQVFALDRQAFQDHVEVDEPAFLRLGYTLSRHLARRLMSLNDHMGSLLGDDPVLRQRFGEARQALFELWDADPH